MFGIPGLVIIV